MTFAIYFATLIGLSAAGFLCWCVWSLGWELYDDWMMRRTRERNRQFDARAQRDCFRDQKGITRL